MRGWATSWDLLSPSCQSEASLIALFTGARSTSVSWGRRPLGVSRSTVKRLEQRGVLDRPGPIPRGNQRERWYRVSDLEAAREALGQDRDFPWTGLREASDRVPKPEARRSWSEVDDDEDDVPAPQESRPVAPSLCPRCGDEVVFVTESVTGGGQVPWCPRRDRVVDLHAPEPTERAPACVAAAKSSGRSAKRGVTSWPCARSMTLSRYTSERGSNLNHVGPVSRPCRLRLGDAGGD
jgi:hypothetical protein